MAQISQEQIKRIALGVIGLIVAIVAVWMLVLQPQGTSIESKREEIAQLEKQISTARATITGAETLAVETGEKAEIHEQIMARVPSGAPIAWFPPRINEFWRKKGYENVQTQPTGGLTSSTPGLEDFQLLTWELNVSNAPLIDFAIDLAQFENEEYLLQINRMSIVGAGDPQFQNINMTMQLLLPDPEAQ